jgi:DNA polymerase I
MRIGTADLEADGLLDTATQVWCGVFKDDSGDVNRFKPNEIKAMLRHMDSYDVLKMHNGIGYDWPLLEKLYGYRYEGKRVDTLIMSRLLNPKRLVPFNCPNRNIGPHSVEAWGWRVGRGKPEHNDWSKFSDDMLHRCTEDVEIQELIYKALMQEAKESSGDGRSWGEAFKLSFDLFTNLQKQEEYGWIIDKEHLNKCINQLTKWIERIDKVIIPRLPNILEINETKENNQYKYVKKPFLKSGRYAQGTSSWILDSGLDPDLLPVGGCFSRIGFRKVDLNSGAETKDYLLKQGWEPLEWNTDDNGDRTSPKLSKEDPFEGLSDKVGKIVAKRVQCRQRRSVLEGLLEASEGSLSISSRVNTLAATGRATHRGIVNIPRASSFYGKQMRKVFTSRDGWCLVGTDSDACQLRMLASRMGSQAYIDAIVNGDKSKGTDNHSLAAKIGEIESRDVAKNVMYCLLFGGGDVKLAKTAKKPAGSGAILREKLYRGLDGLGTLVETLTKEWRKTAKKRYNAKFNRMEYYNGYITGIDKRPILVPFEHQLLVYLLQSDEAIMMSKAYNFMWDRLSAKYKFKKDFGIVCWMHDEVNIACRKEIAEDVKRISEKCIEDAGKFYNMVCPHKGDGKIGKTWYDVH